MGRTRKKDGASRKNEKIDGGIEEEREKKMEHR